MAKGEETTGINGVQPAAANINGINGGQPAAANMKKLAWNAELEAVAQRWVDQCTVGHDEKRDKLDGTNVRHYGYQSRRDSKYY